MYSALTKKSWTHGRILILFDYKLKWSERRSEVRIKHFGPDLSGAKGPTDSRLATKFTILNWA